MDPANQSRQISHWISPCSNQVCSPKVHKQVQSLAKQSLPSQPFPSLGHTPVPSSLLDALPYVHASLIMRSPELTQHFRCGLTSAKGEGKDHLLWPAGSTWANTAQNSGFCWPDLPEEHIAGICPTGVVHHGSLRPFSSAFQLRAPQCPYRCLGLFLPRGKILHFLKGSFCFYSLLRSLSISYSSHFGVICKLAEYTQANSNSVKQTWHCILFKIPVFYPTVVIGLFCGYVLCK